MIVSVETQVLIETEVQKLASKEAIHLVSLIKAEQGFLSTLFLVPKKGGGGQHPVVNLKPLNRNIPYEHFKMEGIHNVEGPVEKRGLFSQNRKMPT